MDIIKLAGGSPANFLDVGGGRLRNRKLLLHLVSDPQNLKSVCDQHFRWNHALRGRSGSGGSGKSSSAPSATGGSFGRANVEKDKRYLRIQGSV
jgi:hypothetical protein